MGGICSCFDGEDKYERQEQERLASEEARARAAEAAQRRCSTAFPSNFTTFPSCSRRSAFGNHNNLFNNGCSIYMPAAAFPLRMLWKF